MAIIDGFWEDAQPQDLIPAQAADLTCSLKKATQLLALEVWALHS